MYIVYVILDHDFLRCPFVRNRHACTFPLRLQSEIRSYIGIDARCNASSYKMNVTMTNIHLIRSFHISSNLKGLPSLTL